MADESVTQEAYFIIINVENSCAKNRKFIRTAFI